MIREWFISVNPEKYDCVSALRDLKKINWKQSADMKTGDIVYIYLSEGYQSVKFKCKVNKTDLPKPEINDKKYDLTGEIDGAYGRYIEMELIEELSGTVYAHKLLSEYDSGNLHIPIRISPEIKEYLDIAQKLQKSAELTPDKHDGSYELVRETVNAYANMGDLRAVDYKDLNLIYLMSVGTWKQKLQSKINTIWDSNLPESEKQRLNSLIDNIWAKAEKYEYENEDAGKASIGLFGTGFFTFQGITDEDSVRNFIQMCIDIKDMDDDNAILDRCEQTLNDKFRGMQAASASMALHCLKPMVFPVFNSNMGADNIYVYFGIDMKSKTKIYTYIRNVRLVKEFRDANFKVKNYRIFDMAAWDIGKSQNYWPSTYEYDPGITKEKWIGLLNNNSVTMPENLRMFKMMLELGGESTCAGLAEVYGGTYSSYNGLGRAFGERVYKVTGCPLCMDENDERKRYYTIPFVGRHVSENGNKRYLWKLRDELREALESMDLSHIDLRGMEVHKEEFDKNIILYGPPGTGKTYNTVIYAVAICEGMTLEETERKPYSEVLDIYRKLKDEEKRIAFTTFHQSYGYEEFIEGIKPEIDNESDEICYTIKDGVFKVFCERAGQKTVQTDTAAVRDGARVWNIILGGNASPELKKKCFDEGTVRIGWKNFSEIITEDSEGLNDKERRILLNFQDEMEIGDIVVSRATNTSIDGIGIITGKCDFDTSNAEYPRKRTVDWLVRDVDIDIFQLNDRVHLDRKSVYALKRISASDILSLIPKAEAAEIDIKEEKKPYVFIIDEINRGNISKIFGELITLIEPAKRKGAEEAMDAVLPYSNKPFSVPENVYIIGTMNTADRSIALIDTALRRRFKFIEKMPDAGVLRSIGADKINEAGTELDVAYMLETINARIEYLYDREHTIGHAFFTGLKDEPTLAKLAGIFKKSVIPLLQEYFYEDYSKIMMILGDNGKEHDEHKFILASETQVSHVFRGDTSDIDIPDFSYKIQESAFENILSYIEIAG